MSAQQLGFLETLLGITTTVVNGKRTLLLCCRTFAAEYSFVSKQMTLYLIPSLAPLKSLESLQNVTHSLCTPDSLSCCSRAGAPRISGALTRARNWRTSPDCQWNSIRPLNESAAPGTRPPTQRRVRPLCESSRERSWSNISVADVQMHGDEMGHAEPR